MEMEIGKIEVFLRFLSVTFGQALYSRDSGHGIRPPGDPSDPDPVEPITSDTEQRNGATVASSSTADVCSVVH